MGQTLGQEMPGNRIVLGDLDKITENGGRLNYSLVGGVAIQEPAGPGQTPGEALICDEGVKTLERLFK